MKNIAIILAGGVGSRMKLGYPKQFSKIAGKTALEHTVTIFQNHDEIDEIIIVAEKNHYNKIVDLMAHAGVSKISKVIYGGKERTDSTLSAINSLQDYSDQTKLIIHDAVRPLLNASIISQCIQQLEHYNAVDVVIPATDTIVRVDIETEEIVDIPRRIEYYQGQTPQAFRLGTLRKAYEIYLKSDIQGTCDCGIVLRTLPNEKIGTVLGSETNIKLTRPVDLFIADKLFQSRSNFSLRNITSLNQLNALKNKVLVVFGGSYGIGADIVEIAKKLGMKTYSFSRANNVDIINITEVKNSLQAVYEKEGGIDCVINTAAILIHKPLTMMNQDEIMNSINTNYIGAVNIAISSYPFLELRHGSLLNFTSSSYTRGRPNYSIYSSTKAAIVNLTQALSEEWIKNGVKINCINPERTKTPMRVKAFGLEPQDTLLNPRTVALASLSVLASKETGNIIDVVKNDETYIHQLLTDLDNTFI